MLFTIQGCKMIEKDGKHYARVSDILNPFNNFNHIPPEILKRKADIGTKVHKAILDEIEDRFPLPSEEGMGYYESFSCWNHAHAFRYSHCEKRFFCEEKMITGQIDGIISTIDTDRSTLIDFKTSVKENPITWPMQAHLYYYLLKKNAIEVEKQFLFIQLNKYGKCPKIYAYKYSEEIMDQCIEAIETYWNSFLF